MHHLYTTQTLENQKCVVTLCIHHQVLPDYPRPKIFFQDSKAGSKINFQTFLEISRATTHNYSQNYEFQKHG